ncbi:MAG TPA: hypothetical protein PLF31_01380 [Candidatus Paceibacterota bacterium]|nr:hypothetical protein [Candidatus Paceibacterota bacterium]
MEPTQEQPTGNPIGETDSSQSAFSEPKANTQGEAPQVEPATEKDTTAAALAYVIFFIPLLMASKNQPFVKFHTKQGMVLFCYHVVAMVIGAVPVLGFIGALLSIAGLVFVVIGILNALNGKEKELPLIGTFASKVHI